MRDYSVFTGKAITKAVELMISKQDLKNQRQLCEQMLKFYGFSVKDIAETLRSNQYLDGVKRSRLGLVKIERRRQAR